MDDKLKSTLDKVVALATQNEEFGKELRERLGIASPVNSVLYKDQRLKNIESYLGLDYSIDNKESTTDFSFIENIEVRTQLISDNREMMRFRYGTRYHEILFSEFCRYAHFQAEMLLNYYYVKIDNNIDNIKEHIRSFNKNGKGIEEAQTLSSIPYTTKLWSFSNEYNIKELPILFTNVKKVRNDLSHRCPSKDKQTIDNYRAQLVSYKIPLKIDGSIDFYILKNNSELQKLFNESIKNTDQYKNYLYLIWIYKKPFYDVIKKIELLAQTIKNNLN